MNSLVTDHSLDCARTYPSTVGFYEVLHEISKGGEGVVCKAQHVPSGAVVALKRPHDSVDHETLLRFEREAMLLARLPHPSIVRLQEWGWREAPFFTMDYIPGQDLRSAVLQHGLPPVSRIVEVLGSIASALHFCHRRGIIHQDVNPTNIRMDERTGRAVLLDFGLARSLEALPEEDEIHGTPVFMAPEQIDGNLGAVGPATDVYGLGVTLFFLLTGHVAFVSGGLKAVFDRVLEDPTPDPRATRVHVPDALAELCMRCMSKSPGERPQSSRAFARQLEACARSKSGRDPRSLSDSQVWQETGEGERDRDRAAGRSCASRELARL